MPIFVMYTKKEKMRYTLYGERGIGMLCGQQKQDANACGTIERRQITVYLTHTTIITLADI